MRKLAKAGIGCALGALLAGCGPQMFFQVEDVQQTRQASGQVALSVKVQCIVMNLDDQDCSRLGQHCVEAKWAQPVPDADGGTTTDYDAPLDTQRVCADGTLAANATDTLTLTSNIALPEPPGLKIQVDAEWPNHVGQVGSPSRAWFDGQ
jgi:hypothetical protein